MSGEGARGRKPKVLLFDLGGVLVENRCFDDLALLSGEADVSDDLRLRWSTSRAVREFERGASGHEQFCHAFVEEWQLALSPAAFGKRFSAWPTGLVAGARELLEGLRQTYVIAVLSNCNETHWERLADVRSLADHAFSSHIIGAVKPDQSAFTFVLDELDVHPGDVCFFDDSRPNVEAARALGIDAYLTDGFSALKQKVAELDL